MPTALGMQARLDQGPAAGGGQLPRLMAGHQLARPRDWGPAEAERRHLTEADVTAIVRAEAAGRDAAAIQYEHRGHDGQAAELRHGTRALLDALAGSDG